uniref:Si:dkey-1d7.3 n=1 Tax=Neolamprologus brichardi TaxID=32507 RepID=A0A3Q4HXR6_NEOBR
LLNWRANTAAAKANIYDFFFCAEIPRVAKDTGTFTTPSPVYPTIKFQVLNVDHVFVRQDSPQPSGNSSLKAQTQTFLITGPGAGLLQPSVNASFGPLTLDASIPLDLLLSGRKILPVILSRQVRSSSPVVKILFHMPTESNITAWQETMGSLEDNGRKNDGAKAKDGTKEVRGACLVSPGGFCVAQLKPEPSWFSSASRSGSSSRECTPQDSLQRIGVGRGRDTGGSGTPMRRVGSVSLLKSPPGNPTFLRLRLGGAVVIQTSSKPLKSGDVATVLFICACLCCRAAVKMGLSFSAARPSDSALWDMVVEPGRGAAPNTVSVVCRRKVAVTPRLLACALFALLFFAQNADILNTAVLTGKRVSVPVKTLAVEASGSVTDVTNYTNCRSTDEDVLKVSERCSYVYLNGKETRGKSRIMLNFTYGFLSAQLEMSVWMPRLPLRIDVADPELSQIKGWRVPVTTGNRSEEEEEMRKGRGCMLQYQHSTVRVLTPFVAQPDTEALPDPLTGEKTVEYFLGSDWQIDVTNLVRYSLNIADPDIARVQDGVVLQGRAVGTTTVQVSHLLSVLAETSIRVVDDKVSVTQLGVQLVSGLSLSLQLSPGSNRAIVATATTKETIEALVSCWVSFSDGAVAPLDLFDRSIYSLTVSTPDERVATIRRTPQSAFVVAEGEGEGQGAPVRVELRICEECQKSKRKSKLAVGSGLLKINLQSSSRSVAREGKGSTDRSKDLNGSASKVMGKTSTAATEMDKQTFKAMTDMEIGMYALVGVSCVAILAFLLNCASYSLCFRKQKTPIQAGTAPSGDTKDHKHDWVWLGNSNHSAPASGAPAQVSTVKREPHCPLQSRHSIDSMGHRGLEGTLPTVSTTAVPERTATLGRSRNSSQHQQFQGKAIDPMANRSATLLARPHRSEPLHSPTSKRNQVQFTTFTTLDIKHLAALKKNGIELDWANRQKQKQQQASAEPQTPLPDMPWPVVKPLGEPQ